MNSHQRRIARRREARWKSYVELLNSADELTSELRALRAGLYRAYLQAYAADSELFVQSVMLRRAATQNFKIRGIRASDFLR